MTLPNIAQELGLSTLLTCSRDVYLVILLRMVRLVGFGGTSLVLVLFLKEMGLDERLIGLFMTLTFIGDLVSSFLLSLVADRLGRKQILVLSSVVMTLTGVGFSLIDNYYGLTILAIVGVLTPGGGEVGPFRSIEQSSIASLSEGHARSDIYAWYTFLGTFCAAFGSVCFGYFVEYTRAMGFTNMYSYKACFVLYAVLSMVSVLLSVLLSDGIEVDTNPIPDTPTDPVEETDEAPETEPLLHPPPKPKDTSSNIWATVIKLSLLFALDSFASSLVLMSWQTYYIRNKFDASPGLLGSIFFATGIVSGFMSLFSTSLTKRIGAIATMVGTHLPASILLALVPLPHSLSITLLILVVRASTQTMDVAPKHVFLAALVSDKDRTAVFGWINVVKTLAQVLGPVIVGALTRNNLQWVTFTMAGLLKATYDIGILVVFLIYGEHHV